MKVLLIDHLLAHYRSDVYELLMSSKEYEFQFIAGDSYEGVKGVDVSQKQGYANYKYRSFSIGAHRFYFSIGIIKHYLRNSKATVICTGVDFHLPHTVLIFLLHRVILRRKFYWWTHGNDGNQGRIGVAIRRFFYKYANGVFAYSNEGKRNLTLMGVKDANVKVVNNSLNSDDYGFLKYDLKVKVGGDKLRILYSGRITKAKRIDFLLESLAILKKQYNIDFVCRVIGGGCIDELKQQSVRLGVDENIEFLGAKYGNDVDKYFLDSDIFVYPSGIGLSIVHALSYGLPVITTNNFLLHFPEFELLDESVNGILYDEGDANDLAIKIMQWYKRLQKEKDLVIDGCVQSINQKGYLPEILARNIIDFL
jgi:glycosyltransferase involved in cell wall biosynthesis